MLVETQVATELIMLVVSNSAISMVLAMALAMTLATSLSMSALTAVKMAVVTCLSFVYGWVCNVVGRGGDPTVHCSVGAVVSDSVVPSFIIFIVYSYFLLLHRN